MRNNEIRPDNGYLVGNKLLESTNGSGLGIGIILPTLSQEIYIRGILSRVNRILANIKIDLKFMDKEVFKKIFSTYVRMCFTSLVLPLQEVYRAARKFNSGRQKLYLNQGI